MSFKWKREIEEIARVVPKERISGILSKSLIISPNEKAVIIRNGEVVETIDGGKHKIGGILKPSGYGKDVEVVLMDTSEKEMQWHVPELWCADSQKIGCSGILRFRIRDPKRFFGKIFAYTTPDRQGERVLVIRGLYDRIRSEIMTRVLEPEISTVAVDAIYGNRDLQYRIEGELEMQLKQTFDSWGIELILYTTEWDFGEYARVMEARHNAQIGEELFEQETLAAEGAFEREGRVGVAGVRSQQAVVAEEQVFGRQQEIDKAKTQAERDKIEFEQDMAEVSELMDVKARMKKDSTAAHRSDREVDQDMLDREHAREQERIGTLIGGGGSDVARTIADGGALSGMSAAQIEALAKLRESESRAKDDKIGFMMGIEDRERADSYRRQELDAAMMAAAQGKSGAGAGVGTGAGVGAGVASSKVCAACGADNPVGARFCGACGGRLG